MVHRIEFPRPSFLCTGPPKQKKGKRIMKKLTIVSDEKNIFHLESREITDTELTLVVSDPNDDADIELDFGRNLFIRSSVINIVKENGSPHDFTIYFNGGALITNSEIIGSIRFKCETVTNAKIEGDLTFD